MKGVLKFILAVSAAVAAFAVAAELLGRGNDSVYEYDGETMFIG